MEDYERKDREYKNRTLTALYKLEEVISKSRECKRCGDKFYEPKALFTYCRECRDIQEILRYSRDRKKAITKYWVEKLGYIPEEKQELLKDIQGIIDKWEANKPTE